MYQKHIYIKNFKINIIKEKHSNKEVNTSLLVDHSNLFSILININIKQK
jgi:hypothetical protein